MKKIKHPLIAKTPTRTKYPDETKYPWLTILLDSYSINDFWTQIDTARETKEGRGPIACAKGCLNCCLKPDVPISELELRGLSWYIIEIMDGATQDQLTPRLNGHNQSLECPLLLDGNCAVYPMRPLACRIFYVFNKKCGANEDIVKTRPNDIYSSNREISHRVAMRFLDADYYHLHSLREKEDAFEEGMMMTKTISMHDYPWENIASGIQLFRNTKK